MKISQYKNVKTLKQHYYMNMTMHNERLIVVNGSCIVVLKKHSRKSLELQTIDKPLNIMF